MILYLYVYFEFVFSFFQFNREHAYTAISEISQVFVTNVKKLNQLLTEFFEQLWEGVKENVLPPLQATLKKFGQIGTSIYDELVSFALNVLDRAVKQLKTYEGDVNKISNDLKESLKTLHDALSKYVQIVQNELSEIIKSITDTIKKIPALKEIKSKLQEVEIIYHFGIRFNFMRIWRLLCLFSHS